MNDAQVIAKLEKRIGISARALFRPDWPNSIDALRVALEKLSEDEWKRLHFKLAEQCGAKTSDDCALLHEWQWVFWTRHLLTIPPHYLAHAIAEALEELRPDPATVKPRPRDLYGSA